MKKISKKYSLFTLFLLVIVCSSCNLVEYVELKEVETSPLATVDNGYVAKEVVVTQTVDFEKVFSDTIGESVYVDEDLNADINTNVVEGTSVGEGTNVEEESNVGEGTNVGEEIDVGASTASPSEFGNLGLISTSVEDNVASTSVVVESKVITTSLQDNREYDGELNVSNIESWQYGRTPCEWIFVEPGIHLVSNYRPKSSARYSISKRVSSGSKGCYIPVFKSTEMKGDGFEARFYVFEDYSKDRPENMLFSNTLDSLTYNGKTVEEILMNHKKLSKTKNGILVDDNNYINIVYVTDLDKLLGSE